MLSPDEVNAFLRDHRAWRRAARRPAEDDASSAGSICSREANWTIFRRGTSDNVFSLKFANSLRGSGATESFDTTASHAHATLLRRKWDSSARCASPSAAVDPLQQLLARNLARGRTASSRRTSSVARSPLRVREQQRRKAMEQLTGDLVTLERMERRELAAAAAARRRTLVAAFFSDLTQILLMQEMSGRRLIFRAWQNERTFLFDTMTREVEKRTGLTVQNFKRHCRLIQAETLSRNQLETDECECRELLLCFTHVEQLRAVERGIEAWKRRERRQQLRLQ